MSTLFKKLEDKHFLPVSKKKKRNNATGNNKVEPSIIKSNDTMSIWKDELNKRVEHFTISLSKKLEENNTEIEMKIKIKIQKKLK